jgi:hypothetical protein
MQLLEVSIAGSFYFDSGYSNMTSLGGMYESSYMYSSQFMNTMNPPSFEKVQAFLDIHLVASSINLLPPWSFLYPL